MAVQNSLVQTQYKSMTYMSNDAEVKLSPKIVRDFLVSGNGNVTDQEVVMFMMLCKHQQLNPFLREAYLIKFKNAPATIVTGKEVFTKRARRNKDYRGLEAGIIVQDVESKSIENRVGTFYLKDDEKLVGGWAKVHIKDYETPLELTVSLEEYIGRKSDGEVNGQWSKKPATMIRKVALVQALREAFPEDFQGLYSQEEFEDVSGEVLDHGTVNAEELGVDDNTPITIEADVLDE